MMEAPCKAPLWCCIGFWCSPCAQCYVRKRALDGNLENYVCCQGYFPSCCGFSPAGNCGERSSPAFCLCLEACCCLSCAVSASRMYLLDKYSLHPDPWDNRIIQFNNCLQMLSCICHLAALCMEELRELAHIIDCIAECVFYTTVGCMTGQMVREMEYQESLGPRDVKMDR